MSPQRSSVSALPPEVKAWLDQALIEADFGKYEALSQELAERGHTISKSALHRYGSEFEKRLATLKVVTEQARAMVAASPDDEDAMNQAMTRLAQEKLFGLLMDMEVDPEKINFSSITRSIAELSRSSIQVKKHAAEARKQALQDAAETVTASAREGGISEDTIKKIRRDVLRMAE